MPPLAAVERLADALALALAPEERLDGVLALTPEERAALLAAARAAPAGHARIIPLPPGMPLVGRAREVVRLERHLAGEGPPLLLLAGEPGIGKSRLLDEAAARAAARGWMVLRGGCTRSSGQEPYAPLVDALAEWVRERPPATLRRDLEGCAWLVRLLPELAERAVVPAPDWPVSPAQERRLMFAAAGRFLANVAGPAGTLLLLDDLQWAGVDALDLLAALLRAADAPPRVVGAYRSTEIGDGDALATLRADLAREGLAEERTLGPLAPAEARRLVDGLLLESGADPARAERVMERAGGHPFFLVSCARALEEADVEGDAELPRTVRQSVLQRVAALPEAARALLGLAAVAGREVPAGVLLAAGAPLAADRPALLAALEAACRAGLLLEDDGARAYRFAHDLIREAILGDLSGARRAYLHLQLARALEALPAPARERRSAELAWHFFEAGEDARALPYTLQAGDRAGAVFAHGEAERLYRTARELAHELDDRPREAEASEKWSMVLGLMRLYDEAIAAGERALALYRSLGEVEGEGRAAWLIGLMHAETNRPEPAITRLEPIVVDLGMRGLSAASQSRLYGGLSQLLMGRGVDVPEGEAALADLHRAVALAEQAIDLAHVAGDDGAVALGHLSRGLALDNLGRLDDALRDYEAAVPLVEAPGDLWIASMALVDAQDIYLWRGDFDTGRACGERTLALADRIGDPFVLAASRRVNGRTAYFLGDWAQARADFERAVAILSTNGPDATAVATLVDLGLHYLVEGRREAAAAYLTEALVEGERQHRLNELRKAHGWLAERDLLEGRAEAARARLEPLLDRRGMREATTQYVLPQLAWACLELGEERRAEALAAESRARAAADGFRLFLVDALRVAAMVRLRQARWDEAADALEESLALCRAMPYPYAEAKALYVHGQLHAARADPEGARERFEQALAILNRLGERLYAEHVERALAALIER
jgi:tetratricopeptide (TPR) repeat protein